MAASRPKRSASSRRTVPPEAILTGHAPAVVAAAEAVRALVRRVLPGVEEVGLPGWRLIGLHHEGRYLGFVAPQKDHVRLGFERGVLLRDDPEGLLEGEGTQVRFVRLARADALPEEALARLLREAVALSRAPAGVLAAARRGKAGG